MGRCCALLTMPYACSRSAGNLESRIGVMLTFKGKCLRLAAHTGVREDPAHPLDALLSPQRIHHPHSTLSGREEAGNVQR